MTILGPSGIRQCRVAVSARADYAVRALIGLAGRPPTQPVKAASIAERESIPSRFLSNILPDLCRAGLVGSRRGGDGGYWLARPASEITLAEIIRAVELPSARRSVRPAGATGDGAMADLDVDRLGAVWLSVQQGLQDVLESMTLLDVAGLPD